MLSVCVSKRNLVSPLLANLYLLPISRRLPARSLSQAHKLPKTRSHPMAKKKSSTPAEEHLLLPAPPSTLPIVDTHTHVASTYEYYRGRYKEGKHTDVYAFVRAMYEGRGVEKVVDVWCEAPVRGLWREFADAEKEKWGGMEYFFVMGAWNLCFFSFFLYGRLIDFDRCPSVSLVAPLIAQGLVLNLWQPRSESV
jgi:hypothetical protein